MTEHQDTKNPGGCGLEVIGRGAVRLGVLGWPRIPLRRL